MSGSSFCGERLKNRGEEGEACGERKRREKTNKRGGKRMKSTAK